MVNVTSRRSIVVSIPACHAGDPGSIPGGGAFALQATPVLIIFLFEVIERLVYDLTVGQVGIRIDQFMLLSKLVGI